MNFILQFEIEGICNLQSLLKIIDLSTKLTLQVTVLRLGKKNYIPAPIPHINSYIVTLNFKESLKITLC